MKAEVARKRQKSKRTTKKSRRQPKQRSARRTLRDAIDCFVPENMLAKLSKHGNTSWEFFPLVVAGLFWSWSNERCVTDRYWAARRTVSHWVKGAFVAQTYQGFIKSLTRHHAVLVALLVKHLQQLMVKIAGPYQRVEGFVAFAVDGTKVATPWTVANEKKLGKRGRKPKGKKCSRKQIDLRPQLTLTLLWHMGLQLPWAWKHGGLAEGERTQFRTLLSSLPPEALIVADAGFSGYDLWREILGGQRHFLIRVGANVELLHGLYPDSALEQQGNIVYLWPQNKQDKGEPPLCLRLIEQRDGKQSMYLVTSILDSEKLTDVQVSRLYSKRWGIECSFRGIKQTLQRSKMRSYTPEHAACELDWSLLSTWLLELLAKRELIAKQKDPTTYSTAKADRILRRALHGPNHGLDLDVAQFESATKDPDRKKTNKKARHDQRKKREKPPGNPSRKTATQSQRQAAQALGEPIALAA